MIHKNIDFIKIVFKLIEFVLLSIVMLDKALHQKPVILFKNTKILGNIIKKLMITPTQQPSALKISESAIEYIHARERERHHRVGGRERGKPFTHQH